MNITGQILQENGVLNLSCYPTLPIGSIKGDDITGAKFERFEWAEPVSNNAMTVTDIRFTGAGVGVTPPATDAFKVALFSQDGALGGYKRVVVPNAYTVANLVALFATGDEIATATVPAPLFPAYTEPTYVAPTCPADTLTFLIEVDAFTGTNNTYTLAVEGEGADGVVIVFAPTSVTGTSRALLASAAQSAWASEMGTGTFTVQGTAIIAAGTNMATLRASIVQSEV